MRSPSIRDSSGRSEWTIQIYFIISGPEIIHGTATFAVNPPA